MIFLEANDLEAPRLGAGCKTTQKSGMTFQMSLAELESNHSSTFPEVLFWRRHLQIYVGSASMTMVHLGKLFRIH